MMRSHKFNFRSFSCSFMMLVMAGFLAAFCAGFFCVIASGSAHAQDRVTLRSGVHDDYVRLVVDWPSASDFDLKREGEQLNVRFTRAAQLDMSGVDVDRLPNIQALSVTGNDPLALTLQIVTGARERSFNAGNRFVLDVYNPAGASSNKRAAQAAVKPAPKPAVKPIAKSAPETVPKAAPVQAVERSTAQAPEKPVLEQSPDTDNTDTPVALQQPDNAIAPLNNPGVVSANLIALSSSSGAGIAVFERDDKIWVVNSTPSKPLNYQLKGAEIEYLKPVQTAMIEGANKAQIITFSSLLGMNIRAQGGGLLWKLIVSNTTQKTDSIKVSRIDDAHEGLTLRWHMSEPNRVLRLSDPVTGYDMFVVTSKISSDAVFPKRHYPEFDILQSSVGLVVVPRVDDLSVKIRSGGVEITRPGGLHILPPDIFAQIHGDEMMAEHMGDDGAPQGHDKAENQFYDFYNWQLGSIDQLRENRNAILSDLVGMPAGERDEAVMRLAKMYLSHGMGAETLGLLRMLAINNPDLVNTTDFRAIRGAARALNNHLEDAFRDVAIKPLDGYEDLKFWKAYILAGLGDWQQAISILPKSANMLGHYPPRVRDRIGLVAAEIALRDGNTDLADTILAGLEPSVGDMFAEQSATLAYLKGESARQKGDIAQTKLYWKPLSMGADDLYRAKAGLALSRLLVDEGEIEANDAIDSLERLRYAWRGDDLEAQIGYWTGKTYFEAGSLVKGLSVMRAAAGVAAGTTVGKKITTEMEGMFKAVFLEGGLDAISPLDSIALYEQFTELMPAGEEGNEVLSRLADRLAKAQLLDRAAKLLDYQVNYRLKGAKAYDAAVKLAAIRLLDDQADVAMDVLDIARDKFAQLDEGMQTLDKVQDMTLLRARALFQLNRAPDGIALLEGLNKNPATNSLRADIAWRAGQWDDAAHALGDVIVDQNISLNTALSARHSELILRRAIALNLAGDRVGLANIRMKYSRQMASTPQARVFEVITRPRQSAALADRDTLLGVTSEVDLFSDFLEDYKTVGSASASAPASNVNSSVN